MRVNAGDQPLVLNRLRESPSLRCLQEGMYSETASFPPFENRKGWGIIRVESERRKGWASLR
jgi:hypothetical protein